MLRAVARGHVLVDGFHRLQAHKRENKETIQAEDLGNLPDAEIFHESVRRNSTHGFQLDESDKKTDAQRLWRALVNLDDTERYEELQTLFSVSRKTVERWTKDARTAEKEEKQDKAWNLWLDCWTERAIAEEVLGDEEKHQNINNWLAKKRQGVANLPAPKSAQHFDVWSFGKADTSAGSTIFGRMPAQIIEEMGISRRTIAEWIGKKRSEFVNCQASFSPVGVPKTE